MSGSRNFLKVNAQNKYSKYHQTIFRTQTFGSKNPHDSRSQLLIEFN